MEECSEEDNLIFVSDLGCGHSLERLQSSDNSVETERKEQTQGW